MPARSESVRDAIARRQKVKRLKEAGKAGMTGMTGMAGMAGMGGGPPKKHGGPGHARMMGKKA